jgi:hypothetical protein
VTPTTTTLGLALSLACAALATGAACSRDSASLPGAAAVPAETDSGGITASIAPDARVPGSGPSASASTTAPAAGPPASATPGVSSDAPVPGSSTRLLDAGEAPRRKLRYTWHLEQKEQLAMDLRTSATTEIAGAAQPEIPLPPVHIVIDIDPRSVTPDGDLHYAWHVSAATVTADPRSPSSIADGMRAEVAVIDHVAGSAVVTARGLCAQIGVEALAPLDGGATGQMVEQVRQTLRDVAAPMPEEEVGRGARWQKISQLDAKASHLTQTDTFTLTTLTPSSKLADSGLPRLPRSPGDDATGTVDDVLAQTAPPQLLPTPGTTSATKEGAEARMESMLASGNATIHFDLSRLVPETQFAGTTTMVVSGPSGVAAGAPASPRVTTRMTMMMRVGIDIKGRLR